MDMQNVSNLVIPEGNVRTIHDKNNRLIWGRLAYDTKYAGNTLQNGTPTPTAPTDVDVVTGTQMVTIVTSYEPYQGSTYTVNLASDNLFDISKVINNSPSLINNGDGTLTVTAYGTQSTAPNTLSAYCPTLQVGDEVILSADTTSTNKFVYLAGTNTQWKFGDKRKILARDLTSRVLWYSDNASTPATISNIKIVKPIELCKIGDYQDYIYKNGDNWYVHKAINKITLSNLTWQYSNVAGHIRFSSTSLANSILSPATNNDKANILCTTYSVETYANVFNNTTDVKISVSNTGTTAVYDSNYTSLSDFLSGVGSGSLYYALATPTDTQITDTNLITQLNNIHQFLTRYGYNSNVVGNLPIIIDKTDLS